jgi:hypothetical protein
MWWSLAGIAFLVLTIQILLAIIVYRIVIASIEVTIVGLLDKTINDVHTRFGVRIAKLEAVVLRDILVGGDMYEKIVEDKEEELLSEEEYSE